MILWIDQIFIDFLLLLFVGFFCFFFLALFCFVLFCFCLFVCLFVFSLVCGNVNQSDDHYFPESIPVYAFFFAFFVTLCAWFLCVSPHVTLSTKKRSYNSKRRNRVAVQLFAAANFPKVTNPKRIAIMEDFLTIWIILFWNFIIQILSSAVSQFLLCLSFFLINYSPPTSAYTTTTTTTTTTTWFF